MMDTIPGDLPSAERSDRTLTKLATADAILFATARAQGATLLTCDEHFEGLPGVTLIEKIKD